MKQRKNSCVTCKCGHAGSKTDSSSSESKASVAGGSAQQKLPDTCCDATHCLGAVMNFSSLVKKIFSAIAGLVLVYVVVERWGLRRFLVTGGVEQRSSIIEKKAAGNGSSRSPTSSPSREAEHRIIRRHRRIEAKIIHKLPLYGLYADGSDVHYRCEVGEDMDAMYDEWDISYDESGGIMGQRQPLEGPLNHTGVFDWNVEITSFDLKMLIVGNSLGGQLHAGLEEAMCFDHSGNRKALKEDLENNSTCSTQFAINHIVTRPKIAAYPDPDYESLPRKDKEEAPPPHPHHNRSGGILAYTVSRKLIDTKDFWNKENPSISKLMDGLKGIKMKKKGTETKIPTSIPKITNSINAGNDNDSLLDVLVFQFPSGHVDFSTLKEEHLEEVILAASNLFQASAVIIPTIAWMNNILSEKDARDLRKTNQFIREFAQTFMTTTSTRNSTVRTMQILDYGNLSEEYINANGQLLGIPQNDTYTLRLKNKKWKMLVAQACASLPFPDDPKGCLPGMVSFDGIHLCPETIHGRINAAMVCLLDCAFNKKKHHLEEENDASAVSKKNIQLCSDECNSNYMSMNPIQFPLNGELDLTPP